jgi:nanoRNase/pAp phosphatase (c-di-AMP/oligoRNAs hydrolase)
VAGGGQWNVEVVNVALADTQPGAGNNALPAGSEVAIVIDHHSWRGPVAIAGYVDVRPEVGATSTILAEYLLLLSQRALQHLRIPSEAAGEPLV